MIYGGNKRRYIAITNTEPSQMITKKKVLPLLLWEKAQSMLPSHKRSIEINPFYDEAGWLKVKVTSCFLFQIKEEIDIAAAITLCGQKNTLLSDCVCSFIKKVSFTFDQYSWRFRTILMSKE